MKSVVILGPAHPLRGGIAMFNQRLAQEFLQEGYECSIVSFSLQYPSFLFPGKSQYTTEPAPKNIRINSRVNSINPINWLKVGTSIRRQKPDLVIVRFWLPLMGPALGTILRLIKKNKHTKIVCIADNVIPHEHRPGDVAFTKYFLKACDSFITMSQKVMDDLRRFEQTKPARLVAHPLYDNFGERVDKSAARRKLGLNKEDKIILFFGFIRKYKGLDILLNAMTDKRIREKNIKLLVGGEFYEDEAPYLEQIRKESLENTVVLKNNFIPDSEVKYFLCAADCVVQPYRNATQSGVTPLAYHFEKPMIVTNVGGLPDLVPHKKVGLVCLPNPQSIAETIIDFYAIGEEFFIPQIKTEKQKYSWEQMVAAIIDMAKQTIKPS